MEPIGAGDLSGLPLGMVEGFEYQAVIGSLNPGDQLILCTDGVADATSHAGEQFGQERFEAILRNAKGSAAQVGQTLLKAVQAHATAPDQFDDLTLVCLGRDA